MLFTSTKNNLLNGLQVVGGIAGGKNVSLPILNNIFIKAKTGRINIISTNLEIGISSVVRGKVTREGEFTAPARVLIDFISSLPDGNLEVEQQNNNFLISCDSQKGKILGVSSEDFPLIPKIEQTKSSSVEISTLLWGLESIISAVSPNETRPEISGCLFRFVGKELILVGTDSFRLAERKIKLTTNAHTGQSVIVPARTIQELIKIINFTLKSDETDSNVKIFLSENQILFTLQNTELISRLIEGAYPDYQQIIPTQSNHRAIIDKGLFLRAIKSVSIFSQPGIFDVQIKSKDKKLSIYSSSGQSGEGEAEIESQLTGGEFTLILNGRYLMDGLAHIVSQDVVLEVGSRESPCLIKPVAKEDEIDFFYIIMPIKQ